ncbi:MAG: hypothetical protein R3B06_16340 [Kofleriaceae bacterium]
MTKVAKVLYENSTNQANNYPLHDMICAMVDDQLGRTDQWFARNWIDGNPRRGRDKLLRDCAAHSVERTFGALPRSARFALIDGDKLEEPLELPASASLDRRRVALAEKFPDVQLFMPDADQPQASNTEGLLVQLATCLGLGSGDATMTRALGQKDLLARDKLFARAAAAGQRTVRDCIRAAQPSLAGMVDKLTTLVCAATVAA